MIGTHRGPFRFSCPFCHARPGKPCMQVGGPRHGKTTKVHSHRVQKFRKAFYGHLDEVVAVWTNAVETNRSWH